MLINIHRLQDLIGEMVKESFLEGTLTDTNEELQYQRGRNDTAKQILRLIKDLGIEQLWCPVCNKQE